MIVSECLSVIEKQQSTLSEDTNEALQKAQQYIRDSLNLQTRVFKMQHIGTWLNTSDFKSVSTLQLFSNGGKQDHLLISRCGIPAP